VKPVSIYAHVNKYFYPGDRITIVGTGISHKQLVSHVSSFFTNPTLTGVYRELQTSPPLNIDFVTPQTSTYLGGSARFPSLENRTSVALAYPGVGASHADSVVLDVLKAAIGEFGLKTKLGHGVASPLYQKSQQTSWISSASTFHLSYSDTSLFGVHVVGAEGRAREIVEFAQGQLAEAQSLTQEDVARAKTQIKRRHLDTIASNDFGLADHVVHTGGISTRQYLNLVEAVTHADVKRVASSLVKTVPTLVSAGDVRGVPVRL